MNNVVNQPKRGFGSSAQVDPFDLAKMELML